MQSASCYDTVGENFYHGLVLGLCAMLDKQTALQQIHDRRYDTEMSAKGVTKIFKYGVAFCGENVQITAE